MLVELSNLKHVLHYMKYSVLHALNPQNTGIKDIYITNLKDKTLKDILENSGFESLTIKYQNNEIQEVILYDFKEELEDSKKYLNRSELEENKSVEYISFKVYKLVHYTHLLETEI